MYVNIYIYIYNNNIYIYIYIYLETRAASKFWCWSSKTVFHLIAAEISGMRRSLGNKYGFRFWCWNAPFLPMIAPFLPMIAPFLPVIAPSLPVQNFHCAVFVELRHVFYIAPFLWTCAWFFCRLGMRPKFWIHESLGIYKHTRNNAGWMCAHESPTRRTCCKLGEPAKKEFCGLCRSF